MAQGNPNPSPETRWKPGQSGNPSGRPKGGLKDFDRKKFIEMTDEQKEEFLNKISPELRYRMAEGNPAQDIGSDPDKPLILKVSTEVNDLIDAINTETKRGPTEQGEI